MNRKTVPVLISVVLLLLFAVSFSACEPVIPGAWVSLDMDGYVVYTANMYSSGGEHIYLYASEEDCREDAYHSRYLLAVSFYPRILGPDTLDDKRTTIVDVSGEYEMHVALNKSASIYSETKKVYLNGTALAEYKDTNYDSMRFKEYRNFGLIRGNPDGKINGVINVLQYR